MHKAKIKIHKAQGIGEQEVESLLIEFSEEFPRRTPLEDEKMLGLLELERDGVKLEFLLRHVLPGGTYSSLLRKMLEQRASQLTVSWGGLQDAT